MGLRLTPGYAMTATVAAIATFAVGTAALDMDALGSALLAIIAVILVVATWRGSTLAEWVSRRRKVVVPTRHVVLSSRDRAAVVRDAVAGTATAWLELSPSDTFAVTRVSADGRVSRDPIDLPLLASLMQQDDIIVSSLEVITLGQPSVKPSAVSQEISRMAGAVPTHHSGRVLLKVTVDTAEAHAAITARSTRGDYAAGLSKTLLAAAARMRIRLDAEGVRAELLTPAQVSELTTEVAPVVAGKPAWSSIKGTRTRTAFYTPTGTPNAESQADWLRIGALRTYENIILRRERGGVVASYVVGFTTAADSTVEGQIEGLPLRSLGGQQLQAATRFVPLVSDIPLALPALPVTSVRAWPGPLGMYVGSTSTGTRTFMHVPGGSGKTLHVSGSMDLGKQMVVRLSKQHVSVDVRMSSTAEMAGDWRRMVAALKSPLVTFNAAGNPDVVVVPEGVESDYATSAATVMVVGLRRPAVPPAASITASAPGELTVTRATEQHQVKWATTAAEKSVMEGRG